MAERQPAVEGSDIHPRRVLVVAGILILTLVVAVAAIWGLLRWWQAPVGIGPNTPRDFQPRPPRLATAPQDERAAYFAEKRAVLESYGWVDRKAGVARVPVEVAMEMMVERGR